MKKLENLGRKLSKDEQKKVIGGNPGGGDACPCGCTSSAECGVMVCSTTVSSVPCENTSCYPRMCVPK